MRTAFEGEGIVNPAEKRTILVVDDAPENIQVVNAILKDDYKVRIATNGAKAIELAGGRPAPDLILLDVMMPEIDGYEVCARLKQSPDTKEIPVIFLTGKTEVEDETRGFEVGAVDYIHKPFSPPVVKARVRTHLMLREARAQLSRQLAEINSELEMAREIQLSILPQELPKMPGLIIHARYVPMMSVAGDYYDFIVVDEKHMGLLVADVSGHGLPAALIASMLQVALTGQRAHASDPVRVLDGLNKALCGKFQLNFVTAAYVYMDLAKGVTIYAGAAHTPLVLWSASKGSAVDLCENGLPLGQFPDAEYKTMTVPTGQGDRLILYTDGIMEARNSSEEQFGVERIKKFLEAQHSLDGEKFADKLLDELWRWSDLASGDSQTDDITLVSVEFGK